MVVFHLAIGFPSLVWVWLELIVTMYHQWSWNEGNYISWTSFWARKRPASQVVSVVRQLDMYNNSRELQDTKPLHSTHRKQWRWTTNSQNWLFCETKDEPMQDMFHSCQLSGIIQESPRMNIIYRRNLLVSRMSNKISRKKRLWTCTAVSLNILSPNVA